MMPPMPFCFRASRTNSIARSADVGAKTSSLCLHVKGDGIPAWGNLIWSSSIGSLLGTRIHFC